MEVSVQFISASPKYMSDPLSDTVTKTISVNTSQTSMSYKTILQEVIDFWRQSVRFQLKQNTNKMKINQKHT